MTGHCSETCLDLLQACQEQDQSDACAVALSNPNAELKAKQQRLQCHNQAMGGQTDKLRLNIVLVSENKHL